MTPDQIETVIAALKPDHHSKSAYTGRIQQTEHVSIVDDKGNVHEKDVSFFITWDTIDQLLSMVRKRTGL